MVGYESRSNDPSASTASSLSSVLSDSRASSLSPPPKKCRRSERGESRGRTGRRSSSSRPRRRTGEERRKHRRPAPRSSSRQDYSSSSSSSSSQSSCIDSSADSADSTDSSVESNQDSPSCDSSEESSGAKNPVRTDRKDRREYHGHDRRRRSETRTAKRRTKQSPEHSKRNNSSSSRRCRHSSSSNNNKRKDRRTRRSRQKTVQNPEADSVIDASNTTAIANRKSARTRRISEEVDLTKDSEDDDHRSRDHSIDYGDSTSSTFSSSATLSSDVSSHDSRCTTSDAGANTKNDNIDTLHDQSSDARQRTKNSYKVSRTDNRKRPPQSSLPQPNPSSQEKEQEQLDSHAHSTAPGLSHPSTSVSPTVSFTSSRFFKILSSTHCDILECSQRMQQIRAFVESIVMKIRKDRQTGILPSASSGPCRGKLSGYLPKSSVAMQTSTDTDHSTSSTLYIKGCVDRWLVEYGDIREPIDDEWMQIITSYRDTLSGKFAIGIVGNDAYLDPDVFLSSSSNSDDSSISGTDSDNHHDETTKSNAETNDACRPESKHQNGRFDNHRRSSRRFESSSDSESSDDCEIIVVVKKTGRVKTLKQMKHPKNVESQIGKKSPQEQPPLQILRPKSSRERLFDEKVRLFHVPDPVRERMDTWEYYYERLEEMDAVIKALIAANQVSSEHFGMLQDDHINLDRNQVYLTWQQKQECILRYLAFIMQVKVSYVQSLASDQQEERNRCRTRERRKKHRQRKRHVRLSKVPPLPCQLDEPSFKEIFQDTMGSFRLFCPICLEYCCQLHGLLPETDPIVKIHMAKKRHETLEVSMAGDSSDVVAGAPKDSQGVSSTTGTPSSSHTLVSTPPSSKDVRRLSVFSENHQLTEEEMATCQSLWYLLDGDTTKVAEATGIPLRAIQRQIEFLPLPDLSFPLESSDNKSAKKRRKNMYHTNMTKYCQEIAQRPHPFPCHHEESGLCRKDNCSCIQNGFFCTTRCCFGEFSPNFFRGCTCSGRCDNNQCPCFAAKRECDPNLCKVCNTCTERAGRPIMTQRCRNDNITMRRHPLLNKGDSDVVGANYGCFAMETIREGQFVDSYKGELLSQSKADDLGNKVYDEINRSYIFDLTSDMVIDAFRMGNMARLINHDGQNYNVQPDTWYVHGDPKIALYASRNIQPQEELFFDYGDQFHGDFLPKNRRKK